MLKVGVDVGGTFTDVFGFDDVERRVYVGKSLTTPDDLAQGVVNALRASGLQASKIDVLVHGTTICTNSLITRSYYGWWPKVAFITTEGFRDTLEVRRGRNLRTIDMYARAPKPLIPRRFRFEVPEKVDSKGRVVVDLDIPALKDVAARLAALGVDSIGVCFINAHANPVNELKAKEVLERELPGVPVTISSEVVPKFRELPRMVTTAVRAILRPIVKDYLEKLQLRLKEEGFQGLLLIVKGDGGTAIADVARERPEEMLESGPAAGVYAGLAIGAAIGVNNVLTQDMGGTSYDVCIIENGEYLTTTEYEVDFDTPLAIPMVDVRSIGTGGGSIIWLDEGGSLRVGPQSAGAKPGPVCYGFGGVEPTITDANLVLGRIDRTLGGKTQLDLDGAVLALKKKVADRLGLSVEEAAEGAIRVSCANMARANAIVTTSRGRDPRHFTPVVFGGAGPMHACLVAEELGVTRAVVPAVCGVASAMGAVLMPLKVTAETTCYMVLSTPDTERVNRVVNDLAQNVRQTLQRQGVAPDGISVAVEFDMRYVGQNYEVTVPVKAGANIREDSWAEIREDFHQVHEKEHFVCNRDFEVALVNVRVVGRGVHAPVGLPKYPEAHWSVDKALREKRQVYFGGKYVDTDVYDFNRLGPGHAIVGPAIVEMGEACVVVAPGWKGRLDEYKNLHLNRD